MAQNNAATAVQNLFKTPELKDKILFTLLCLLVYRIGAAVTAPGINPQAIAGLPRLAEERRRSARSVQPVHRRPARARHGVRVGDHAVHLGEHLPADRAGGGAADRQDVEGRGRPEKDQPVVALRDGGARRRAGVGLRDLRRVASGRRGQPRASASVCRWRSSSRPARSSSCGWASRSPSAASATAPA